MNNFPQDDAAGSNHKTVSLNAQRGYALLDTGPDRMLDDLTALAATICDAPIALISIVDGDRLWFKSRFGMEAGEAPLNVSICAHTLRQADLFVVTDSGQDERFSDFSSVTGAPDIRFYAGTPLLTPDGLALGTLCVMDRVPRTLTASQKEALQVLGRQVMTHLELRRHTLDLTESEDLFAKAFWLSPDGMTITRLADVTIIKANEAICRLLGKTVAEIVRKPGVEFSRWLNASEKDTFLQTLTEKGECLNFETRLQRVDGTFIHFETSSRLITLRGDVCFLSVMHNVTADRLAIQTLKASEKRYRRLFESAKDGILILDADSGMVVDVNPFVIELLGFSHEQFLGKAIWELGLFKDLMANEEKFKELRDQEYVRYESLPLETVKGRLIEVEFVSNVYFVDGGKVIQCNVRDITERKHADTHMKLLETCVGRLNDIVLITKAGPIDEPEPRILFINEAFVRQTGYSREEAIGRSPRFMQGPKTSRTELDRIRAALLERKPVRAELINYTKDGRELCLEIDIVPVADPEGHITHFVAVERDITERKKLEQKFLQAQRMESIGTLAGGIAHDLNNVLSPIMMALDVLTLKFPDKESQKLLAILQTSAQHGAEMVRQVLSFARGVDGRRMEVQIRHLVLEIERIANSTFPKQIQVLTIIPHDLLTVVGDPTQIHQVLLNLCVNARDAMPDGGTLTISAENLNLDAQYLGMSIDSDARPGNYVLIQVRDTGAGMTANIIDKIFDPFFTTKALGRGTGLGLSTTLGIIKSHDGFIRVYSEVGKGTTFKIYLPAKDGISIEAAAETVAGLPHGHGELILVVDDECAVCEITKRTLETFGYEVIVAGNGVEAIAAYAARRAEIAVVLTDIMMPVMDGLAAIRVLQKMNPSVRIIAASGLAAGENAAEVANLGVAHFLPKPYTAETLLRVLHEILPFGK